MWLMVFRLCTRLNGLQDELQLAQGIHLVCLLMPETLLACLAVCADIWLANAAESTHARPRRSTRLQSCRRASEADPLLLTASSAAT